MPILSKIATLASHMSRNYCFHPYKSIYARIRLVNLDLLGGIERLRFGQKAKKLHLKDTIFGKMSVFVRMAHMDDIMQRKVDNIFYVTEADGLSHLERVGGGWSHGAGAGSFGPIRGPRLRMA